MERRQQLGGAEVRGKIEQKRKRIHGHGQQCGDCWREVSIKGLNNNEKNTIRLNKKMKQITGM